MKTYLLQDLLGSSGQTVLMLVPKCNVGGLPQSTKSLPQVGNLFGSLIEIGQWQRLLVLAQLRSKKAYPGS